jgi:hypothetical protein
MPLRKAARDEPVRSKIARSNDLIHADRQGAVVIPRGREGGRALARRYGARYGRTPEIHGDRYA